MEKLDISPENVDLIVLSHPHGDHTGGLSAIILRQNKGVKLYLGASFSESFKERARMGGADVVEICKEEIYTKISILPVNLDI